MRNAYSFNISKMYNVFLITSIKNATIAYIIVLSTFCMHIINIYNMLYLKKI